MPAVGSVAVGSLHPSLLSKSTVLHRAMRLLVGSIAFFSAGTGCIAQVPPGHMQVVRLPIVMALDACRWSSFHIYTGRLPL